MLWCSIGATPRLDIDLGETVMHKSIPLRWIEQAEVRSVREQARYQRAEWGSLARDEDSRTAYGWFDWLRRLGRILLRPNFQSSTEADADRELLTILITDIVESTRCVAEIGDRDWRV